MKSFIIQNWPTILLIAAFLVYAGYLAVNKKWEQLRGIAYKLMLQAERTITGTKQGRKRFEQVFQQIYTLIPAWLRFWFPETEVREKLQEWFIELKDYLDNGKLDGIAKPPDVTTT